MEYLHKQGYHAILPEELLMHLRTNTELPDRPIMLTFDDGYEDFYKNALPAILKYDFKAAVFIVADLAGDINLWRVKGVWQEAKLLTWDQIKELSDRGFSVGSHGLTHLPLTRIYSPVKLISQIKGSKIKIESHINKPVKVFSYPYGKFNGLIKWLIKLYGYEMAFSICPGVNEEIKDLFSLKRIEINNHNAGLESFVRILKSQVGGASMDNINI